LIEENTQDERLIILDTETTGINPREGHRIVEIGCVEMINRQLTGRNYHVYVKPMAHGMQMVMEQEVIDIHGLTDEFLRDKPTFEQIGQEFVDFIKGARLVIHNAKFDVGFMDHEFSMLPGLPMTEDICSITDTLKVAKDEFGSPKTLDYLARFYKVDKLIDRTYHGALIDAQLLAFVYIEMTRKQATLNLQSGDSQAEDANAVRSVSNNRPKLKVLSATADELSEHEKRLAIVKEKGATPIWQK
jgi:DNA polymerase III subunit epsilon